MNPRYTALLSYSHRYQEWVRTLQRNLERGLDHQGRSGKVFLDESDLGAGRSWVGQLEGGLASSEHFILVLTPEALASPWVQAESEGFLAHRPNWRQSHFHLVQLVSSPRGPFLASQQHVDFEEHDEAGYLEGYRRLLGSLLGRTSARDLPEAPPDLEVPQAPRPEISTPLRQRLVEALARAVRTYAGRVMVQNALSLKWSLDGFPTPEATASAVLVLARGDDQAASSAMRVVDVVATELHKNEQSDLAERLEALAKPLRAERAKSQEPDLLSTYRSWVTEAHMEMVDYFQRENELELLDRIFVELEIREDEPFTRAHSEDDPKRERSVRDLLKLEQKNRDPGRWVLLGDPGAGKTTLLRHLAASLSAEKDPSWTPVNVPLARALRHGGDPLEQIERRFEKAGNKKSLGLQAALATEAAAGRLLLLLDGLDEVDKEDRQDAASLIRLLADRYPTPLIVTSRPIGYRSPAPWLREVRLLPFDRERRHEFLSRWFGRHTGSQDHKRAAAGVALLEADAGLWELSGNPLYLTLMALILEEDQEPARNRTRLYDQVFDLLLDGRHRPEGEEIEAKVDVKKALQYLGYGLTEDNRDAASPEELERRLLQEEADSFRCTLERVPRWRGSMRRFLDDLARRTGILGPHDGKDAEWSFWHRTFREALAAERLEQMIQQEDGFTSVLARAGDITGEENRWAEPYALLTARVDNSDGLVRELMQANSTLGLRALATAERVSDETLVEVLDLSGDAGERGDVYQRLPDLVGDGERTLRLLDRLRKRTTNGNDLFFIHEAVVQSQSLWPNLAPALKDLVERLFSHIPPPEEALFREVETPLDGRVAYWREVPLGNHPLSNKDSLVVDQPLWAAATSVTIAQYRAFDRSYQPPDFPGVDPNDFEHHPAQSVTWFEAISFCRWLASQVPGCSGSRLPNEGEWEVACQAGTPVDSAYWSGDDEKALARVGWFADNSDGRTHRVGEKPANPWGLYDVHGNVWEWTSSEVGSVRSTTGLRVFRGGSFDDVALFARSAFRFRYGPSNSNQNLGFRVVRSSPAGGSDIDP